MTNKINIAWLATAEETLWAQLEHIAGENPDAAGSCFEEIETQVEHLANHPNMGRKGRVTGTRELVIQRTPFVLVYRVANDPSRIEVLRVLHGAQQWPPAD